MPEPSRESLVILAPALSNEAMARLRSVAKVTQVLAPRLALVQLDGESRKDAENISGVLQIAEEAPPELPGDLSEAERLFVSAWQARQKTKDRVGEGLPWDAPGFRPPDGPGQGR